MTCIGVIAIGHKVFTVNTIICELPRILEKVHIKLSTIFRKSVITYAMHIFI